ncbi:FAD-binding oxidoreductase [Streptacidiphilus sp. PB12-B1b]|uniref:NAD(P)/FAD-dependent oxidoreductase n=1 Tax=Streptacidiphilus sp. PB12-B1b TaxID=2705012 RepID=UPI0015FAD229|nr:FAD-binding oxidoreductase [Streptacidiphilus sp. PB12-B1b]QMU78168.1 FAD-binding oxidoreductase [Streptacidiphilus sp. PB12-B1b]
MRVCVVGAGIAGMLLAWRLVRHPGLEVVLLTGGAGARDATHASGGLIRGFDPDPDLAGQAQRSLEELGSSALLRQWAGYRAVGSLYILGTAPPPDRVAALERRMPGSVSVLDRGELEARYGLAGLPAGATAVLERQAGYFSPEQLRTRARADFAARGGVLDLGPLRGLRPAPGGVQYRTDGAWTGADAVVLATGAWTGPLLAELGLPAAGLRTKVIQCAVYSVGGDRPPAFVDENSGLYGRPAGPGQMLFGLPTERWDCEPGTRVFLDREERAVRPAIAATLPGLRLGAPHRYIAAADAYSTEGRLALHALPTGEGRVYTFTGGSGGSAKTTLAAGADAAAELLRRLGAEPPQPEAEAAPESERVRPIPIPEGGRT